MRIIAAYLLLVLGGNATPSAADVKKVLASVGVEADDAKLDKLVAALEGKDLNELIDAGLEKLATVPTGGSAGPAAEGGAAEAVVEEEEEEEEDAGAADGAVGGLFGDDDGDDGY